MALGVNQEANKIECDFHGVATKT